ncbi:biotin-dependent carboxyltransferase family protein [Aeromicrobium sp. CTD01-1L150]|uniref:5-oxoprolinase subunit C family protein n=1 Tax=Aeromicrobium sp. CTD01-1L150 TaxID=3341830 RepID=UPI0035C103FC
MTSLTVVAPGTLTTVQDLGRPGHAHLGVAPSGALDPAALRLANRIVGNPEQAPALETTFGGLVLRAHGACVVATTGAPSMLTVESAAGRRTHGAGTAVHVPDGAVLRVAPPARGLRGWLAVRGGVRCPEVLGSASSDLLAGIGTPLIEDVVLDVGPEPASAPPTLEWAPLSAPGDGALTLRVVPGPRDDWFDDASSSLGREWTVDPRSNRVGIRLDGAPLQRDAAHAELELPSEGTVAGAVQVAANGLPVLFLADHPVTGGYPVIACVVTADLPLAAQAVPGQSVRFRPVTGPRLP